MCLSLNLTELTNRIQIKYDSFLFLGGMSLKKLICTLLALVLVISVVGCSRKSSPESSVSGYLDAFIDGKPEEGKKFLKDTINLSDEGESIESIQNTDPEFDKAMKKAYGKITYKILDSTVNGDTAQVKTEITAPDLKSILMEIIQESISLAFINAFSENADDNMDELMNTMLIDKLNSEDIPMVTKTININLVKEDDLWLIVMDDNLLDALTGNMSALTNIFDN